MASKEKNSIQKRPLHVLKQKGVGGIYIKIEIPDEAADEVMLQQLKSYREMYRSPFFPEEKELLLAIETVLHHFRRLSPKSFFSKVKKISKRLDKETK